VNITIEINTDNDAFTYDSDTEVANILTRLVRHIEQSGIQVKSLYDTNGNRVGRVVVSE
jgi:YD repeat-containing protein